MQAGKCSSVIRSAQPGTLIFVKNSARFSIQYSVQCIEQYSVQYIIQYSLDYSVRFTLDEALSVVFLWE